MKKKSNFMGTLGVQRRNSFFLLYSKVTIWKVESKGLLLFKKICGAKWFVKDPVWLSNSSFVKISLKHCLSQTMRSREMNFWENVHHVSFVTYHVAHVTCHISCVTCHIWCVMLTIICYQIKQSCRKMFWALINKLWRCRIF